MNFVVHFIHTHHTHTHTHTHAHTHTHTHTHTQLAQVPRVKKWIDAASVVASQEINQQEEMRRNLPEVGCFVHKGKSLHFTHTSHTQTHTHTHAYTHTHTHTHTLTAANAATAPACATASQTRKKMKKRRSCSRARLEKKNLGVFCLHFSVYISLFTFATITCTDFKTETSFACISQERSSNASSQAMQV